MLNFEIKISSLNFPFFLILWTSDEVDFMYFAFSGPWKASCTGSADIQLVIEFVFPLQSKLLHVIILIWNIYVHDENQLK